MTVAEIVVTLGGLAIIGFLAWFFFGPKQAHTIQVKGNVQEIVVTVKGGYSPDIIRVQKDVPLRLMFDRQEAGDCSSRIVFHPNRHLINTSRPVLRDIHVSANQDVGTFKAGKRIW